MRPRHVSDPMARRAAPQHAGGIARPAPRPTAVATLRPAPARALRQVAILALCGALCLMLTCAREQDFPNLVLIGLDTLRPDHLGCYGYERATSPAIDRFAESGVLFENVVAPSPWTLPSFATVFTSLYPTQHGARGAHTPMRMTFPTLATLLKTNGYATGAIINAPYLKGKFKVDRGFDFYYMTPPEGRKADGTTEDALAWIDENKDGPFFIFVHYFDPHIPYSPPAPYDTIFDPGYRGKIKAPFKPKWLNRVRTRGIGAVANLSDADRTHIKALYDGEIAFTDEAVGALLEGLDERGLTSNTLIVLLTDHGEEFFEHDGFEHGHTLFDELIKAALIFSLPGTIAENARVSSQARLVDVMPTILAVLGVTTDARLEGASLVPLLAGERGVQPDGSRTRPAGDLAQVPGNGVQATGGRLLPAGIAYSEAVLYGSEKKSISAYPWKLIYDTKTGGASLFNLKDDPGELRSIGRPRGISDSTGAPDSEFEAALAEEHRSRLESALLRTMFSTSDTWYVELGGTRNAHRFDMRISSDVVRGSGHLKLHKWIDSNGNILPVDAFGIANIGPTNIEIQNVRTRRPLTLALKPPKPGAPIRFDLYIDGKPATGQTHIGTSLAQPVTMPFIEPGSEDDPSSTARPGLTPDGPYFLLWLSRSQYQGEGAVELDEETRKQLKALGYIQ